MTACPILIDKIADLRVQTLAKKIENEMSAKIKKVSEELAREILKNPELSNITEIVRQQVLEFGADIASTSIEHIVEESKQVEIPKNIKGQRNRTLTTILGEVSYTREAFYDPAKNRMSFTADEILGIHPGQMQSDLLSRMVKLGIEVPFAEAAELCDSLMGIKVSEGAVYNSVIEAAQLAQYEDVVPSTEEINKKIDKIRLDNPEEKVHIVVGVDGAMEPMRPTDSHRKGKRGEYFWKECKGFRIYAVVGDKEIEHLISWHQIGDDEELGKYLRLVSKSFATRTEPLVVVADGAKWIWNQVSIAFESFKTRKEIIDWYHVVEHLSGFANTQFGNNSAKKLQWLKASKERLMTDKVESIIHGVKRMNYKNNLAKKYGEKLCNYLSSNIDRLLYGTYKKQGLTIGSGGMESANKSVSHIRLKRNGCWWKQVHANEILRLRCAKSNGKLDSFLSTCWHKN